MDVELLLQLLHLTGAELAAHCQQVTLQSPHPILVLKDQPDQPVSIYFPADERLAKNRTDGEL
jgi:hypothetical protein